MHPKNLNIVLKSDTLEYNIRVSIIHSRCVVIFILVKLFDIFELR